MAWVTRRKGADDVLRFQGRYSAPDGKKRTVGTYTSKREALKAANRAEGKVLDGTWIDPSAGRIMFREYAEDVLGLRRLEVQRERSNSPSESIRSTVARP